MIPASPTQRRVLRQLALHQLGRHMAYPEIHGATEASLRGAGLVEDRDKHRVQLTAAGWTAVGQLADEEPWA